MLQDQPKLLYHKNISVKQATDNVNAIITLRNERCPRSLIANRSVQFTKKYERVWWMPLFQCVHAQHWSYTARPISTALCQYWRKVWLLSSCCRGKNALAGLYFCWTNHNSRGQCRTQCSTQYWGHPYVPRVLCSPFFLKRVLRFEKT